MAAIKKSKFRVDNGTDFDTQYFETSADQIKDGVIVDLADLDLVTEPGCLVDALAVAELNSKIKSTGTIETLAWFHTTVFSGQGGIDLSKYSYLVLNCCAGSNSTPRALASTIISIYTLKYGDSGSMHEAAYAGDPSNYCASVYFSGNKTNATVNGKVKNATYCQAFLYGVLK